MFVLENKRTDEVHDNWRSEGEERQVNEIHPNARGFYPELFAQPRTDPENLEFEQRYILILFL